MGIILHIITSQLLLYFVDYKAFIVLKVLLDVNLKLNDVVEHFLNLSVKLFA